MKNMKKIITGVFLFLVIVIHSQTDSKSGVLSDKSIDAMRIMRSVLQQQNNFTEQEKYDAEILKKISVSDISSIEKNVSTIINDILFNKIYKTTYNSVLCFDILVNKITNPEYFFEAAYTAAAYRLLSNEKTVSIILSGLSKYLLSNPSEVFRVYYVVKPEIDMYIVDLSKNGTNDVIVNLVAFLRTYINGVKNKGLKDDHHYEVVEAFTKMGFDKKTSSFDNFAGVSDLKKEFLSFHSEKINTQDKK